MLNGLLARHSAPSTLVGLFTPYGGSGSCGVAARLFSFAGHTRLSGPHLPVSALALHVAKIDADSSAPQLKGQVYIDRRYRKSRCQILVLPLSHFLSRLLQLFSFLRASCQCPKVLESVSKG
jgi:hypothetical protein